MKRVLRTAMMALLAVALCFGTLVPVANAAQTSVTANIEATVKVTGTPEADAEATFELKSGGEAPMPDKSAAVIAIKEGENKVSFPIEYNKVGVYEYTLRMVSGTYFLEKYDGKVYNVKVTVTNNAAYDGFDVNIAYREDGSNDKKPVVYELTLLDRKVVKKWIDQDSSRPSSVQINLLCDGEVVEGKALELSKKNNWQATWTGLDSRLEWSVKEAKVPTGYTVSYKYDKTAGIWYVTNTGENKGGSLLQTGQLNWPIPVLCAGGFLLMTVGMLLMKRKEEEYDV